MLLEGDKERSGYRSCDDKGWEEFDRNIPFHDQYDDNSATMVSNSIVIHIWAVQLQTNHHTLQCMNECGEEEEEEVKEEEQGT